MASNNWILEPISKAAERRNCCFGLKEGANIVGKSKRCCIPIPSILCSTKHCTITLRSDQVFLKDESRNGTYVMKNQNTEHHNNNVDEQTLEHGDVVSFGFNLCKVYDPNLKSVFIYRLVKKPIETISLDDSDEDEDTLRPETSDVKVQVTETIELDSDSDLDSGEELFENASDFGSGGASTDRRSSDDEDSYGSDGSGFVVTRTIYNSHSTNMQTPIDEDDDEDVEGDYDSFTDDDVHSNGSNDANGNVQCGSSATSENEETKAQNDGIMETVEKVKRTLADKPARQVIIINPLAPKIRKRRATLSEDEYNRKKEMKLSNVDKQLRSEKLRQIEANKKAAKEANGEGSVEHVRPSFMPKVKNTTVSRSNLLSSDMLSSDLK